MAAFCGNKPLTPLSEATMAPTGYMKCAEQTVSEQTSKGAQAKNYAIQVVKSGDSVI